MAFMHRLYRPAPLAASLGMYVPAVTVQRLLGLARTILFMWMMVGAQFGLWGLGSMVFSLAASVVTLSGFNGIQRYVSYYQVQGRLAEFYRATTGRLTVLAAALTAATLALSPWLARWSMGTVSGDTSVDDAQRLAVFQAAAVNALLMGLYLNMTAWMRALRVYRLMSCADVLYGLLFLALAPAAMLWRPTALTALAAHAASLAIVLAGGTWALRRAVAAVAESAIEAQAVTVAAADMSPQADGEPILADLAALHATPASAAPGLTPSPSPVDGAGTGAGMFPRLLAFSAVSMVGGLIALVQGYVSLWFVQRYHHEEGAALYQAYFVLCQAIPVLASTVWVVVFSHASMHWEQGRRDLARRQLETTFKGVAAVLLTLAVVLYATADAWVVILPTKFRLSRELLPWLLTYFLATANLGYAYVASNLRERPGVSAYTGVAAVAVNALLAAWLVPTGGPLGGAQSAAAAGLACLLAGWVYVAIARFGASPATWALSFAPLLLLLGAWPAGLALAGIWVLAAVTPWVFSPGEKQMIASAVRAVWRRLGPRAEGV
jgi:O-antigen/teichoic acid export membrane protein